MNRLVIITPLAMSSLLQASVCAQTDPASANKQIISKKLTRVIRSNSFNGSYARFSV